MQTVTISCYVALDDRDDDTLADSGLETALDGKSYCFIIILLYNL